MEAAAGLRALFPPPAWTQGGIAAADAEALLELVRRVQPARVLEIGVGAGVSSAALLYALDTLPPGAGRALLSVDVARTCYFDPRYATGAAAAAMYPVRPGRSRWILDVGTDARRVRATLTPGSIDLLFVDGDHRHPWPLLDVLHLAPWMRPEAWIALHDIALARVLPGCLQHGAEWLFAAWPANKIAGTGAAENLGVVQLPAALSRLVPMAIDLLTRYSWEAQPAAGQIDLPEEFAEITAALRHA